VVDGWVLPKAPAEVFAAGAQQGVPLLIGNNARERTPQVSTAELRAPIQAMYGPLADRAFGLYGLAGEVAPDPLYGGPPAQWVVDTLYRCPVVAQLLWHVGAGHAGYEYQFDLTAPGREEGGSVHGAEVGFVWGTLGGNYSAAARETSVAMERYWTNFAKTGDPNGAGVGAWPRFDATARGYMEFTAAGPVAREGLRRPYCDLYVENVERLRTR
jgi:para-nitrobenzyl esterase